MADRPESEARSSSEHGAAGYYCYMCNKEVAVEGPQDALACTECHGGFIEATASLYPEYVPPRRSIRRRRTPQGETNNNTLSLSDALEQLYPHEMLFMVQSLLEQAQNRGNNPNPEVNQDERPVEEGQVQQGGGGNGGAGNEGRVVFVRERHENSEEVESDSDTGGLRLELEGFDLNEDEDDLWEHVDDEDWDAGGDAGDAGASAGNNGNRNEVEVAGELGDREEMVSRARNHLTFYMRELFQNLMDQNVEVRVELPDMYLGNPGDYLDSLGFEQLLQQLAENDNTRRGAPPAAKSAIEGLGLVKIKQHHIDSGIAVCAICKELLTLEEPAKQLPCLHLYHQDCILPWLSSRNSCPVCRYELPTDDPDYEEQKKSRRIGTAATEEDGSSEAGQNSGGGSSVSPSEEPCRDAGETSTGSENGAASSRGGSSRSWLILAVGPLLSVMGFMFLLGNHLVGRPLDRLPLNPFHELHLLLGNSNNRYWWSFL